REKEPSQRVLHMIIGKVEPGLAATRPASRRAALLRLEEKQREVRRLVRKHRARHAIEITVVPAIALDLGVWGEGALGFRKPNQSGHAGLAVNQALRPRCLFLH